MSAEASGYLVVETVHGGGGCVVYRAADGARVPVTLKVASQGARPGDIRRLENEYQIGQQLEGPLLVKPVRLDRFDGRLALVLEAFAGPTLDRLLGVPFEPDRFLALAIAASAALEELHRQGVIHLGLTPRSLVVDEERRTVALTDFGRARRLPAELLAPRSAAELEGMSAYLSPEATGLIDRPADARSDLYSLGAIFFHMLAGRPPFPGNELLHADAHRAQLPAEVPPLLAGIVGKLLARPAEERYQSAAGLRADLEEAGQGASELVLGRRDGADRLTPAHRLFGRDRELRALEDRFASVRGSATPGWALISGPAGVGKSSLAHELGRRVLAEGALFVTAAVRQDQRGLPHAAMATVLRALAARLGEDAGPALAALLGDEGQVLVDLVPALGRVMGPQPPLLPLGPRDAAERLGRVVNRFLQACANRVPLVVFLDDLQNAGADLLRLISALMSDREVGRVLLVTAHRDDDVRATSEVSGTVRRLRELGGLVHGLPLPPLAVPDLAALLAAVLRVPPAETTTLAELCHARIDGNPLFALHLLERLRADRLLTHDPWPGAWRWDPVRIGQRDFTRDLIAFLGHEVGRLPPGPRATVELASCLGLEADAERLAALMNEPAPVVARHLLVAAGQGLMVPVAGGAAFRFSHERVREAAYQLMSREARAGAHLRIGRLVRARGEGDLSYDVLRHLILGAGQISEPGERRRVADLALAAGRRALAAHAPDTALEHLRAGAALLGEADWEADYPLTFAVHLELAQGALGAAEPEEAVAVLRVLETRARTKQDRAAVYVVRQQAEMARGDVPAAYAAVLSCLPLLGVHLPASVTWEDVLEERTAVQRLMGARAVEELATLPPLTSPEARMALGLPPLSYQGDRNLYCLQVLRMLRLGLEQGLCDELLVWFGRYGLLLAGFFGDHPQAYRFAKLARDLAERRGARHYRGRTELFLGLVEAWTDGPEPAVGTLRRALAAAAAASDSSGVDLIQMPLTILLLASGAPLETVAKETETALLSVRTPVIRTGLRAHLQLVKCLQGRTRHVSSLEDGAFGESEVEAALRGAPALESCWYWLCKLRARVVAGDHPGALAAAQAVAPLVWSTAGRWLERDFHFYTALAHAALGGAEALEAVREHEARLRRWAEMNPDVFRGGHALVAAELARLQGRPDEAARGYEEAVRAARRARLIGEEALALETAARFHETRGLDITAQAFLGEARSCYARWGAAGKVRQIDGTRSPRVLEPPPAAAAPAELMSVVKAAQALSQEMLSGRLLRTLMELVLTGSGAQRACLILGREGAPWLEAEAVVRGAGIEMRRHENLPVTSCETLPRSLVQYAFRTGEMLMLEGTALEERRARDGYLARHQPKALLCLPVRRHAEVVSVLYLESRVAAGVFTPARLMSLELLGTQVAISLENAELLERERARRAAAEESGRRNILAAQASALLAESLDHRTALAGLARLVVGSLADWCVIDLLDGEGGHRVASAHRDPELEPLLADPEGRSLPSWGRLSAVVGALAGGHPRFITSDPDEAPRLGGASGLVVPLVSRGQVLGGMSLGSAQPGRFGPPELELCQEMGRRAGVALENGQLYAEVQDAVRVRDEFLSVASHELNTPTTALLLSLQAMLDWPSGQTLDVDTCRKMAVLAERQARRLGRLIGDLLDVTRLERNGLQLALQPVDLSALMRDVLARYQPELARSRCQVTLDAQGAVTGQWDPMRIEQVAVNLLSNAAKFGEGKPIEVRVQDLGDRALLVVRDQGIGIDPAQRDQIFNRFTRAVSSVHYGGLGLGLYVCRRIVSAHGGSIDVESVLGGGAAFSVELPLAVPARGS